MQIGNDSLEANRLVLETERLLQPFNPIEDINLFSILNMENKEVSAHENFLFYIFRPFRVSETCIDAENLKLLYRTLRNDFGNAPDSPMSDAPDVNSLRFLSLEREVSFYDGRLDFLLRYDDNAAVIELKIWAGEQPEQIQRYREYMRRNEYSEENVFFLTPQRRNPVSGRAYNITLEEHLRKTLSEICVIRKEHPEYTAVISQYIKTIDKLVGGDTMQEVERMFTSASSIRAADMITSANQAVLTRLLLKFREALFLHLVKENVLIGVGDIVVPVNYTEVKTAKEDHWKKYYRRGFCNPAITFSIKGKLKSEFQDCLEDSEELLFFIEIAERIYAGFSPKKGLDKGESAILNEEDQRRLKELGMKRPTGWFWDWDYIYIDSQRINFTSYSDEIEGFLNLLKDGTLDFDEDKIQCIVFEIVRILLTQSKHLYDESCFA